MTVVISNGLQSPPSPCQWCKFSHVRWLTAVTIWCVFRAVQVSRSLRTTATCQKSVILVLSQDRKGWSLNNLLLQRGGTQWPGSMDKACKTSTASAIPVLMSSNWQPWESWGEVPFTPLPLVRRSGFKPHFNMLVPLRLQFTLLSVNRKFIPLVQIL